MISETPSIVFLLFFFSDALERMQHSVSVTVVESQMRDGSAGLSWNVTSLCRLEAEVWLCMKELAGGQCKEVIGSRQKLKTSWTATHDGHWVKNI